MIKNLQKTKKIPKKKNLKNCLESNRILITSPKNKNIIYKHLKTNFFFQMSSQSKRTPESKAEVSPNPIIKHKRRKRDDLINRNYSCGCGKSYLSYPALYTHLKQKHNGKQPLGTILPSSNRGRRPKPQREESGIGDATANESTELKNDEKIEEFVEYLANYAEHLKSEHVLTLIYYRIYKFLRVLRSN